MVRERAGQEHRVGRRPVERRDPRHHAHDVGRVLWQNAVDRLRRAAERTVDRRDDRRVLRRTHVSRRVGRVHEVELPSGESAIGRHRTVDHRQQFRNGVALPTRVPEQAGDQVPPRTAERRDIAVQIPRLGIKRRGHVTGCKVLVRGLAGDRARDDVAPDERRGVARGQAEPGHRRAAVRHQARCGNEEPLRRRKTTQSMLVRRRAGPVRRTPRRDTNRSSERSSARGADKSRAKTGCCARGHSDDRPPSSRRRSGR